jgi:hypothetical protein
MFFFLASSSNSGDLFVCLAVAACAQRSINLGSIVQQLNAQHSYRLHVSFVSLFVISIIGDMISFTAINRIMMISEWRMSIGDEPLTHQNCQLVQFVVKPMTSCPLETCRAKPLRVGG